MDADSGLQNRRDVWTILLRGDVRKNVEIVDESSLGDGPKLIHVTDFEHRVIYLPVEGCKTFVGLRQNIESRCLANADGDLNDYILHSGHHDEELLASQWPDILTAERSMFVRVRIRRRAKELPTAEESKSIEAMDESRLIEYASLDSDDSEGEDDQKALVVGG